jgi:hypothetical protein
VRPAVPAPLRLSARAYACLLRAYPAPFRAEFGGEMALVFSDCCRAAWRAGGAWGVWRELGRTVLDVLASAPPLWVERLEEAMEANRAGGGVGLWVADRALVVAGLGLVGLGAWAWPLALPLGWMALGLAFFAWVAEADGIALPRPGRVAIRTRGCGETPLDFTVRHGKAVLLFTREEAPDHGGWLDTFAVYERRDGADVDPVWEIPFVRESEWLPRGRTPVAALRFEHHERVSYVTRESLRRSLADVAA